MSTFRFIDFVRESNRIEGIDREPTFQELWATDKFLMQDEISIDSLASLVKALQPEARLRDRVGLDVMVGGYLPPIGGPLIRSALESLLRDLEPDGGSKIAWAVHHEYETLHPFTDGNGRSGRALWLWQMGGTSRVPLGFLHTFYYQCLKYERH